MYIVCIVCRPDRSHAIEDGVAAASSIYTLGCGVFINYGKIEKCHIKLTKNEYLIDYLSFSPLTICSLFISECLFSKVATSKENTRSNCLSNFHYKEKC